MPPLPPQKPGKPLEETAKATAIRPPASFVILAEVELLVVRQPPAVQEQVEALLVEMRAARAKGIALPARAKKWGPR